MENTRRIEKADDIRLGRCMNIAASLVPVGTNKDYATLAKEIKELARELYKEESQLSLEIQTGQIAEPVLSRANKNIEENKTKPKSNNNEHLEV